MSALFYFVGFLAGVAVFLYVLSLYHSGKDAITRKISEKQNDDNGTPVSVEPGDISCRADQVFPRERRCPLRGASLSRFEALYASKVEMSDSEKIMIYGCRYCYRPDENPDESRKNEF